MWCMHIIFSVKSHFLGSTSARCTNTLWCKPLWAVLSYGVSCTPYAKRTKRFKNYFDTNSKFPWFSLYSRRILQTPNHRYSHITSKSRSLEPCKLVARLNARPETQTRNKQNIDTKQTQWLIYRFRCITCKHKSHRHESLGKGEGGEGRGKPQAWHQRNSNLAYSLSFYSAQTESTERALVSTWERRQEERRGGHASRWQYEQGGGNAASAGRSSISCSPLTSFVAPIPSTTPGGAST